MGELAYEDWKQKWHELCEKLDREGYESFTPDERIWFNIRGIIDAIGDGGLYSYYYNHWVDYVDETLEDLQKIDAIEVANILNRVNQLFPNGRPPKDIDERNDIIESWEGQYDELIESFDEEFYNALEENLEIKLESVVKRVISNSK